MDRTSLQALRVEDHPAAVLCLREALGNLKEHKFEAILPDLPANSPGRACLTGGAFGAGG